jgi:hypothetical protein
LIDTADRSGQSGILLRQQHNRLVNTSGHASGVDLRHPVHAQQRVGPGTQHQLLQELRT